MVGRERKSRKNVALAGSHQRCWMWGRNAVLETLRAGRWTPLEVVIADRVDEKTRKEVLSRTRKLGLECEAATFEELTGRCRSSEHQGLMAKMPEFPYATLEDCVGRGGRPSFLVILDGIQDPHNFGAIARSTEVFGGDGIVIGEHGQCEVTAHVARTSAGAVNHLAIARVLDVASAIGQLKAEGVRIIGAAGEAESELQDVDFRQALAIVIGNEGRGLSPELIPACDQLVRIPQVGQTESLNAAVAAGILCYEVHRQRTT
jgi:23S rRNA (guanosine2251-2'-O)-methyltransferase